MLLGNSSTWALVPSSQSTLEPVHGNQLREEGWSKLNVGAIVVTCHTAHVATVRCKAGIQHVKGGKGEYSCHWFYNLLLGCGRVKTITKHQFDLAGKIDDKALRYIGLVNDHQ